MKNTPLKSAFVKFSRSALIFLISLLTTLSAQAEKNTKFSYAVIYDFGQKFDRAFNEAVYNGVKKFQDETGIKPREFELTNEAQSEQFLRALARKKTDMIIVVGFSQLSALKKIAREYPETHFTLLDANLDLPNVQSVAFKEHEGSFLVGAIAALKTKTGKIGFIGGMDVPLIRKFSCGYRQGAAYINPQIELIENMTGNTPHAWNNPAKGAELAISQIDRGADVIYTAAGKTSMGVLQAAADKGIYAIGVDVNQNYLYPGRILTSMVKSLDLAAYNALKDAYTGQWKAGTHVMGLKENGVYWALDEYNKALITPEMKQKLDQIKQAIISGKLKITDYMKANHCRFSFEN